MRSRLAVLILVLAAALAAPAGTLADGDPASDVLLGQDVYYPYSPPVSASLQHRLNGMTAAARKSGYGVKIAIIEQPVDLGVIPDLFGRPAQYAKFLDQEISFQGLQRLLVVMPSGFGTQGLSPAAAAAVTAAPKPAGNRSDDLAQAAITALSRLARAAGHPIAESSASPGGSGGGATVIIIAVLAVIALASAAGLIALRRRRPAG